MGPGGWLQGDGIESTDLGQILLQLVHQLQTSLDRFFRLQGVDVAKPGVTGHLFVDTWIILHRAGAQRVKISVDGEIPLGKTGVVPDHLRLRNLREVCLFFPEQFFGGPMILAIPLRERKSLSPRLGDLKQEGFGELQPRPCYF